MAAPPAAPVLHAAAPVDFSFVDGTARRVNVLSQATCKDIVSNMKWDPSGTWWNGPALAVSWPPKYDLILNVRTSILHNYPKDD
jgi:hypothetical protein